MRNQQEVIALHREMAACWASKGRADFSAKHEARAAQLEQGAAPTNVELAGDRVAVMAECAERGMM